MLPVSRSLVAIVLSITLAALSACSANSPTCAAGAHCVDAGLDARDGRSGDGAHDAVDPTLAQLVSIEIMPADTTITAGTGMANTVAYTVQGMRRDGTTVRVSSATWSLDSTALGTIGGDGVFTANASAGGVLQVRADVAGASGMLLHAMTSLTVRVQRDVVSMGVPATAPHFFDMPPVMDSARQVNLLYPLDGALMPNNVAPPDVQWSGGNSGDLYRVQITKTHVTVNGFVMNSGSGFGFDWPVDRDAWRAVLESDPDEPATIHVDRYDASTGQVIAGAPLHVTFAHASIFGDVYYWDLSQGHLLRIDAVTASRQQFIPNPPALPSDSGNRCVACHAISQNGRYLSAELWGGSQPSTVFDLTADLTPDPAPTLFPPGAGNYLFSSFNPDATRLVTNPGTSLVLIDPHTGNSIGGTGLPGGASAHPAWSPDGSSIAYIANIDGPWAVDFTTGNLAVVNSTGADQFGSPNVLHTGSSLGGAAEHGSADSHPTWSPDSAWIAFAHGTHSRSNTRDAAMNFIDQPGAIYLIARAGGAPVRLDNANGGPSGTHTYWPTFSPFQTMEPHGAPGFYWLAFYSRRDYGNAQAGTQGTGRRQLWVTAVSVSPTGSADPSHVPYWLPGQDRTTDNMAAYWAPTPCRTNGSDCDVSSDCCSGMCLPDPMNPGRSTCQPPPPTQCHTTGQTCGGASDCCPGLMCVGNVCQSPPG